MLNLMKSFPEGIQRVLKTFTMKYKSMHSILNQSQKKNSGSKYLVITALVLVVLIATYFFTILGLVVAFGIGKYCSNNYYGSNNKAENKDGTDNNRIQS